LNDLGEEELQVNNFLFHKADEVRQMRQPEIVFVAAARPKTFEMSQAQ
jgi:hypothetical protein